MEQYDLPFNQYEDPAVELNFETDIAVCYIIEGHGSLFETREAADQHRDFLCMTYGNQDGWPISAVAFEYAR